MQFSVTFPSIIHLSTLLSFFGHFFDIFYQDFQMQYLGWFKVSSALLLKWKILHC